jgi:hypothetical protein
MSRETAFTFAEGIGFCAPGLDFLDKLSQATGNAQAPDRESLRYACIWKATIMLFSRYKVAYEKKRKIVRNVASIADFKKSFFAEIDKVENRDDLEKLSVKYLGREERDSHGSFAFAWRYAALQLADNPIWAP